MAKLVSKSAKHAPDTTGPGVKRVRVADGGYANVVRSNSATLSSDLGYIFKANVRKVTKKH